MDMKKTRFIDEQNIEFLRLTDGDMLILNCPGI